LSVCVSIAHRNRSLTSLIDVWVIQK
jgi:hypothetical protein